MDFSENGISLLKQFEGSKNRVYRDSAGLQTLGIGHLLTPAERQSGEIVIDGDVVNYADGLSNEQVDRLLLQDIKPASDAVNEAVTVPINQNQFDALVCFTFNVGVHAFENATLLRKLNAGDTDGAAAHFLDWVKAGQRVVQGLVNRRRAEAELFSSDPS